MGNFSRGGNSRGGFSGRPGGFRSQPGGFGGKSSGGFRSRDSRGPVQKFDATCSKCGKACQVPFKPTSTKPVYCSDCFRQSGNARDSPRGMPQGGMPSSGVSQEQIKQIHAKLDKILNILKELKIDASIDKNTNEDTNEDKDEEEDTKEAKSEDPFETRV